MDLQLLSEGGGAAADTGCSALLPKGLNAVPRTQERHTSPGNGFPKTSGCYRALETVQFPSKLPTPAGVFQEDPLT